MKTESELCVGCNKCIFDCPTYANNADLEKGENKIHIDNDLCISCGKCIDICDHDARSFEDDTAAFFADLEMGKRISVIAAPSIKHNIPEYQRLFGFLKSKGVTVFYDVSLGADITVWGYIKAARERNITSMISGPCPVVVGYIENFKPELIPFLSPVQSPAVCLAIYMKNYQGITNDIAFLSPCIGKKTEFSDSNTKGVVGYNVTYKNLLKYIHLHNIDLMQYENIPFGHEKGSMGLTFSHPGGLSENVRFYLGDNRYIYQIEGIDHIKRYLDEYADRIKSGKTVPFIVDALNCEQGCNLGTATRKDISIDDINDRTQELKKEVNPHAAEKLFKHFDCTLRLDDFIRTYTDKSHSQKKANYADVERVFQELEKTTEGERNINCFSCGYGNCYDFVNAVALGKNHIGNCFRYSYKKMSEQSEKLTQAIEFAKQMEESLKIEREINEFAVQTKYELVSLLDVPTQILTVYKKSETFEKGGLKSQGDYNAAVKLVLHNMVCKNDHKNFKRLFFDSLTHILNKEGELILEYRLKDIDSGEYRWKRVLYRYFQNSKRVIIQLTEDIHNDMVIKTELEAKNEKLILNEKCFKALSEQTNKIIFEWDFDKNKISAMSNFQALFGRESVTQNSAEDAISVKAVHTDDREVFANIFEEITNGNPVKDVHFRIIDVCGVYHWCSLSGVVIKDDKGKPYKAIGSLENIEEQLQKEKELRQKAEKDQLTELYNKATTELLIKKELAESKDKDVRNALMIIDMDNFKNINDKLGHLYGDMVLTMFSEKLKSIFHENHIVGRVGGDEFSVFIENFGDLNLVVKKAKEVCKRCKSTYTVGDISVTISTSVGIAISPDYGTDFDKLYKNADIALYNVKAQGKDNYMVYGGQAAQSYQSSRTEIDSNGTMQKNFKENRVEYIFRLLYESDHVGGNIEAALQFITEHFGFSRGYIFETDSSGIYTSNTFEWCADNISPEIDNLQNLPVDVVKNAHDSFREKGFYIVSSLEDLPEIEREVLERQNIKSMVLFGMIRKGEPIGFIGFDDCLNQHIPTSREMEDLRLICDIFATFLMKQRAAELAQSNYTTMLTVLNNFEGYTYVVDSDTYEILFENDNARSMVGNSCLGKFCYHAYMRNEGPCDFCPIAHLADDAEKCTAEIYNKGLGVYLKTTVSRIDWTDGKKNYLVCCIDITEYK